MQYHIIHKYLKEIINLIYRKRTLKSYLVDIKKKKLKGFCIHTSFFIYLREIVLININEFNFYKFVFNNHSWFRKSSQKSLKFNSKTRYYLYWLSPQE